jgi:hypothetical protein
MNKWFVAGFFFVIFVAGLIAILVNNSISFSEFMRSLSHMNPRVLGLMALPLIAAVFMVGVLLHKKREERMWKRALKDTRDKRQN